MDLEGGVAWMLRSARHCFDLWKRYKRVEEIRGG